MKLPPIPPFRLPANRTRITGEPDELGTWTPKFPDMLGHRQYGGGALASGFTWPSNPKEWQEELSDAELRREAAAGGALGPPGELASLDPGATRPSLPPGQPTDH